MNNVILSFAGGNPSSVLLLQFDEGEGDIAKDTSRHFDGEHYRMGDFVVMPNHAHLLVAFATREALKTQCDSWLHYTGWTINKTLGQSGRFWQQEPFDHLVRSPEQYEYLRKYIADNPKKAGLEQGEFHYRRYPK